MPHRIYHDGLETPEEHRLLQEATNYLVFRNGNAWPEYKYLDEKQEQTLNELRYDYVLAALRLRCPIISAYLSDKEKAEESTILSNSLRDLETLLRPKDMQEETAALESAVMHDLQKENDKRFQRRNFLVGVGLMALGGLALGTQCKKSPTQQGNNHSKKPNAPDKNFTDKVNTPPDQNQRQR